VAFGWFAGQTFSHESALQQSAANQSRSIATLTDSVLRQDKKVAELNQSVQTVTRDLAAQMSRLSSQLETQDKEMAGIQTRLSRVEVALGRGEQGESVGE
jgi:archaellum component FlaC